MDWFRALGWIPGVGHGILETSIIVEPSKEIGRKAEMPSLLFLKVRTTQKDREC